MRIRLGYLLMFLILFTSTEIESTPGTENEKGTGFGLKLCHDLLTIHKGTISIESKVGEGSCFIITLPAEKTDIKPAPVEN